MRSGSVAIALFVGACGGGSSESEPASSGVVGEAADAGEDAARLIDRLGSDAAATDAVIIAMDRGYSGEQILDAVEQDGLRSDGTIDGENPAGSALDLVLYESDDGDEEAGGGADIVLVSFVQIEQTPIERMRANASAARGSGDSGVAVILSWLKAGFTPADVVEILILGADGIADYPDDPDGPDACIRVVDELYCPGGERFPVSGDESGQDAAVVSSTADEAAATPDAPAPDAPQQLSWEGDMTANPEWVDNPVAGRFEMTRTAGTDDFQITLSTTNAKTGTFTTDGFNEVVCDSEWSSVFEGTGTFWDVNDLGIEFEGTIARDIVYTGGPCDAVIDTEVSDFTGVVVFVTEDGIEASFNAWDFSMAGPPPQPVGR